MLQIKAYCVVCGWDIRKMSHFVLMKDGKLPMLVADDSATIRKQIENLAGTMLDPADWLPFRVVEVMEEHKMEECVLAPTDFDGNPIPDCDKYYPVLTVHIVYGCRIPIDDIKPISGEFIDLAKATMTELDYAFIQLALGRM